MAIGIDLVKWRGELLSDSDFQREKGVADFCTQKPWAELPNSAVSNSAAHSGTSFGYEFRVRVSGKSFG